MACHSRSAGKWRQRIDPGRAAYSSDNLIFGIRADRRHHAGLAQPADMHFEEQPLTVHPAHDARLPQRASRVELALYCGVALMALVAALVWFAG
jgi:hypothetical protein